LTGNGDYGFISGKGNTEIEKKDDSGKGSQYSSTRPWSAFKSS
jgi:hypothetical protein